MMYGGAAAASGAAAGAAAIASAIKASGAIVQIEPEDFVRLVDQMEQPLVVTSPSGFLTKNKYLTHYKGLFFYAQSAEELYLPKHAEVIRAKKIWIP